MTVAIITRDNGKGLSVDQQIFATALNQAGCEVRFMDILDRPPRMPVADLALFLEVFSTEWSRVAHRLILVPNQEWWHPGMNATLSLIDRVWAKTQHAEDIFRDLGCEVDYIGMTSLVEDAEPLDMTEEYCLHVAGNSPNKGTAAVVAAWREEFPKLIIVARDQQIDTTGHRNIEIITERLEIDELRGLQAGALLNVHPTEAEGWGHAITESMALGVPVIVTDAPPMDEIVDPATGWLSPWRSASQMGMGARFFVDIDRLTATIAEALSDVPEIYAKGERAREWFRFNDDRFRDRLHQLIHELCTQG